MFSLIILCAITFAQQGLNAQTIVEKHGLMQVQGNKIVDKNNEPVCLAGNSLFWSNAGDVSDFYNSTTVNHLVDEWNSSIIRASMGVKEPWDWETGYIDEPEIQEAKIRNVIDAAIAKGIYVIIDWHSHEAEIYQDEAVVFFGKMASIYGDYPNVIYELYNEPVDQSWSAIKSYAEAVTAAIRAEDPDNLIVVGTPFYSQRVDEASLSPINDVNTAYTLHFYAGTHSDWLRSVATTALNNGIALFVTEWGTVNADGDGDVAVDATNTWLEFLKSNDISHVNWTVSDKDESSCVVLPELGVTGLLNEQLTTSGYFVKEIIKNWTGNGNTGLPIISISNPTTDITVQEGYTLDVEANASDSNGTIENVQLFINNTLESEISTSPYIWNSGELDGLSTGIYTIKVVATDNDGNTAEASFVLTVIDDSGTDCSFGAPLANSLPSIQHTFSNVHVLGATGPSLDNVRNFTVNWDLANSGLYQFSFGTDNGSPNWYVDLRNQMDFSFNTSQPSFTLSNSGFSGLDGSYWVALDGNNFVMVSKTGGFSLYFSNTDVAPVCSNAQSATALKVSTIAIQNPIHGYLELQNVPSRATKVVMYDFKGMEVLSQEVYGDKNDITLNMYQLAKGIYILKIVSDNDELFVKKIVKK